MENVSLICTPDYADNGIVLVDDATQIDYNRLSELSETTMLLFVRQGYMHVEIDGRSERVGRSQFLFKTSQKEIANPSFSRDFEGHCLLFSIRFGQQIIAIVGNLWYYLTRIDHHPILEIPEVSRPILLNYYELLRMELKRRKNMYYDTIIPSLIRDLLCSLINDMLQSSFFKNETTIAFEESYEGAPQSLTLFNKFLEMVASDQKSRRPVHEYAEALGVSPKHLSWVCKRISNRSAKQWINDSMLNSIENHLRFSDKTIKEISEIHGFPSVMVFSKYVRHHFGVSPKSVRSRH